MLGNEEDWVLPSNQAFLIDSRRAVHLRGLFDIKHWGSGRINTFRIRSLMVEQAIEESSQNGLLVFRYLRCKMRV